MNTNKASQPIAGTPAHEEANTPKPKNPPTPPSANGKRAYQSLPQVMVSKPTMEGTPYIGDRDTAITVFRSYFTPEVWVQMHIFALYTDNWDNLLCVRRINVGSAHRVEADVPFILDLGVKVRARNVSLCLTRTSWVTNSSFETDEFIKEFAKTAHSHNLSLEYFFIMSQQHEEDIASELSIEELVGPDTANRFILQ